MTPHATVTLAYHGLEFRCPAANLSEDRPFSDSDSELLADWAARHRKLAGSDCPAAGLLQLGHEIFDWLNGPTQFLTRLIYAAPVPLRIDFAAGKQDSPQARAFLDAPWELLACDGQHWALGIDTVFCPVRRVGAAPTPHPPSPNRLNLVFMAAAPRGADNLDYEAEEASILTATRNLGLDLVVEESGELDQLSACVAREKPDVVQISCHGALTPEPGLLLEDDLGNRDFVSAPRLVSKLASHHPRLLFLSACETAEAHPVLDSLARSLVRSGVPAVLGWSAPVLDTEATIFAANLYQRLTEGDDLAHALAYARLDLGQSEQLPEPAGSGPRSRDWHLARLYLSPTGGGALATANGPRRLVDRGHAVKTFLDAKGKQVQVAGELEFVGRRREIQKILREFRAPASQRHAGVLIHGLGRQGKSSLAARVAHRLEHSHETVVLYRRYDAQAVLAAFRDRLATPAVSEIVNRHLPQLAATPPASLLPALTELLEGPCAQQRKDDAGRLTGRPVLLVIDDFESALDVRRSGRHILKTEFVESIRACIEAFNAADTDSRLLFTGRFQFTLPTGAADLAERLLDVPLHGMNSREARKQAAAKLRNQSRRSENLPALLDALDRILAAASGNPGLQNMLFSLCLENPAACHRCLEQMEDYLRSGALPEADQVRQFLENLTLGAQLELLTPPERMLLRAATLFELPAPLPVFQSVDRHWVQASGDGGVARMVALGLFEVYEDLFDPRVPALAVNAIVRPLAGTLSEAEQQQLAAVVITPLFERWGGETGGEKRGYLQDHELTRLALLAPAPHVLAATSADALRYLDGRFEYRRAAAWSRQIVAVLDAAGVPASVDLLRTAAERCDQVGEVEEAAALCARALAAIEKLALQPGALDPFQHAATLITHARALVRLGRPEEAVGLFERARELLPPGRERAIVLGDIARIRADKGEVDAALQLHQEELDVYEELGDKRERAVTLGDIARIRAAKGEVDAALQLHQEELDVYEELGDKRSRAVTLGDIARIRTAKGEVDAALQLHQEMLAIFEGLGDKRSRAVTLGDIARIRAAKGEVDAALQLHQEMLAIFEGLGDKRSRAVTLGDIARIRAAKGEVDAALQLHQEMLAIFEGLGDKRSRAVTLGDIARIRAAKGEVDAALQLHQERLAIFEGLGDKRSRAVTLGDIARIRADKGEVDAALQLHQEELDVYEELGDKRSRAVTLGDIARIRAAKGEVDAALQLHQERLAIFEGLGDQDGIANTLWSVAQIELERRQFQEAFEHLTRSYEILMRLGRLDGICFVGLDLGRLLCAAGQRDEGRAILTRSRDGFVRLGRTGMARRAQQLLDECA